MAMNEYIHVQDIVKKFKSKGKKVTFVHGVFDLLHVGHIQTLQLASKLGDVLIVGVDSDSLVRSIKGNDRPIISENDRRVMVSSLCFVDEVFIISPKAVEIKNLDKFYDDLYRYLNIDTVASGPSEVSIEISRKCKRLGIKYVKLGVPVTSTSEIINKIRNC